MSTLTFFKNVSKCLYLLLSKGVSKQLTILCQLIVLLLDLDKYTLTKLSSATTTSIFDNYCKYLLLGVLPVGAHYQTNIHSQPVSIFQKSIKPYRHCMCSATARLHHY